MISFLKEFWAFAKARKKFWMVPIVLVMLMTVGLILAAEGTVVAPFIYTLF